MAKWKDSFDPTPVIDNAGITFIPQGCDCTKTEEFEVNPEALQEFCIPAFNEQIVPYQNIANACDRVEIQEIETPAPHCWGEDSDCFNKCDRLEINLNKCDKIVICTV